MKRIAAFLGAVAMTVAMPLATAQAFGGLWYQRYYYDDEYHTTQVGYTSINCDGSSEGWGEVTPWYDHYSGFC